MIIATGKDFQSLVQDISRKYKVTEDNIQIVQAPGYGDVWHVIKDRLPMSGLHVRQQAGRYILRTDDGSM